jgi:Fur family zinc uptake transcriptional regulator
MSHAHQPVEEIIASVRLQCDQQGLRLTSLREQVLSLIVSGGKPVKAYDLLDQLKDQHHSAAPPTVYRALDFLLENGFIHRLESINAFMGCGHPEAPHDSQFLICDRCETTVEIDDHAITGQLADAARSQGFEPQRQTIEVHGLCGACSEEDR